MSFPNKLSIFEEKFNKLEEKQTTSEHRTVGCMKNSTVLFIWAPKCTNSELILTPSLSELKQMLDSELKHVKNFSVKHRKYGSITFTKPVDLTDVDIDKVFCWNSVIFDKVNVEVIIFGEQTVKVYADEDLRPPVVIVFSIFDHLIFEGQKLNTRAEICLYNVVTFSPQFYFLIH